MRRGSGLRYLLQQRGPRHEEERQAWRELIDPETGADRCARDPGPYTGSIGSPDSDSRAMPFNAHGYAWWLSCRSGRMSLTNRAEDPWQGTKGSFSARRCGRESRAGVPAVQVLAGSAGAQSPRKGRYPMMNIRSGPSALLVRDWRTSSSSTTSPTSASDACGSPGTTSHGLG